VTADDRLSVRFADTCPRCGSSLVLRRTRSNGRFFTGCDAYPDCSFTEEYDARVGEIVSALSDQRRELRELRRALERLSKVVAELEPSIRDVIAFAHPDRWPDAIGLATAVVARLNPIRERLSKRERSS
jgi:ssDNA-binding Zn-finger/Zn-ribbon topoisomerase 1